MKKKKIATTNASGQKTSLGMGKRANRKTSLHLFIQGSLMEEEITQRLSSQRKAFKHRINTYSTSVRFSFKQ